MPAQKHWSSYAVSSPIPHPDSLVVLNLYINDIRTKKKELIRRSVGKPHIVRFNPNLYWFNSKFDSMIPLHRLLPQSFCGNWICFTSSLWSKNSLFLRFIALIINHHEVFRCSKYFLLRKCLSPNPEFVTNIWPIMLSILCQSGGNAFIPHILLFPN